MSKRISKLYIKFYKTAAGKINLTLWSRAQNLHYFLFADGKCKSGHLEFQRCTGIQITSHQRRERSRRNYRENSPDLLASCTRRCESQPSCLGFNVDLKRHECQIVEGGNTSVDVKEAPGNVYFESVCLTGIKLKYSLIFSELQDT